MPTTCSVLQCRSVYGQIDSPRFHNFPKDKKLCRKWISMIRRAKFWPSKNSKVCSKHFETGDYITNASGSKIQLRKDAIPSKQFPARSFYKSVKHRPYRSRGLAQEVFHEGTNVINEEQNHHVAIQVDIQELNNLSNSFCQTEDNMDISVCIKFNMITESNLKYLTGFTFPQFNCLFQTISNAKNIELPQKFYNILSYKDQLIICLCKYKLNLHFKLLSLIYGFDAEIISEIFKSWTHIIYKLLRSIDFWNLRYKSTNSYTVILDCTEISTQHSSNNPKINQQLFSNYKNRQTLKYLVGIDEKGGVIFVSDVFGGGISDNEIIAQSKILDLLQHGDTILSDRGFTCTELFETKGVALNVPPFKGPRSQLEEHEVIETRIVANRRIHVERVINLSKKNLILTEIFPAHLWPCAKEIIYNANMLCNFKNSVVK